jgi:hypothetical protein
MSRPVIIEHGTDLRQFTYEALQVIAVNIGYQSNLTRQVNTSNYDSFRTRTAVRIVPVNFIAGFEFESI